ncbi:hypothetical protein [Thiogranum longum]
MFAKLAKLFLIAAAGFSPLLTAHAVQQVEERADPSLPDIASVQFSPGKAPMILFNPILCLQAGRALCEFYRYHEYGHIEMRHNERHDLSVQEKEREADRWAAEHAPFASVMAAYRFFASGGGSTPIHGKGRERAARMVGRAERVSLSGGSEAPAVKQDSQLRRAYPRNALRTKVPLAFGAMAL